MYVQTFDVLNIPQVIKNRWYFYTTQLLIVKSNNATIFVTNIKNITAILT